jgi:RNA polymerase sigma-70 factor (ECF subfamily)
MVETMEKHGSVEDLVRRAQDGDAGAFGELGLFYRARLEALAASRMGPALRRRLSPEEVVQETLTRGLESLHRFRWQGEDSFLRWLGAIVRNVIAHAARDHRASLDLAAVEGKAASDATASRLARREERFERLERALAGLTAEQRQVIRLSRIDGLKVREIAERTGRSVDAVKQLLLRGLRSLKRNFGDTESLGLPDRALESDGPADPDRETGP